jgi:hypothetical protein
MHQRPRAGQPVAGGAAVGRCGVGADHDQVLDQEALAAVDKRSGGMKQGTARDNRGTQRTVVLWP